MLCALLACVALFLSGIAAQASAVSAHQHGALMQVDAVAQGPQDSTSTSPANALEFITADLAGDLPELLLAVPLPLVGTTRFDRQARHMLYALPHPFPERPQRPPRGITVRA